ncbi:MAG: M20/M25/M40 family metallo-hydrolase [Gemmatimonadota bacterium]
MSLNIDGDYNRRVLADLVRCDSVNPAFTGSDGQPGRGERPIADLVAKIFSDLSLDVQLHESVDGRSSVIGVLKGTGDGPSLMLNGHLDTVGPGKMEQPFEPHIENGRLYGRGAYDMKGALAACIGCVAALVQSGQRLRGDLVLAMVADEEDASLGTIDVLDHCSVNGAIVTEPTELRLCVAHKGFTWLKITTRGFACHGSDFKRGVDANMRMGRILGRLSELEASLRDRTPHPLVGPPSIHAPLIRGGVGPSVYSPECVLELERRTIPGETEATVMSEIETIVRSPQVGLPEDAAVVESGLSRAPFEAAADSAVAEHLTACFRADNGGSPEVIGVPFWTDAALIAASGADTVVFGPTGDGAHQDVEWVDLDSVDRCARVLAGTALGYCTVT